jgi:quercetin dioxygenase-like cupin family protein
MEETFAEFESEMLPRGFATVVTREWKPQTVVDSHSHPFDASALVVHGPMRLTVGDSTRHLSRGDSVEIPECTPQLERYGPVGAAYRVAQRLPGP